MKHQFVSIWKGGFFPQSINLLLSVPISGHLEHTAIIINDCYLKDSVRFYDITVSLVRSTVFGCTGGLEGTGLPSRTSCARPCSSDRSGGEADWKVGALELWCWIIFDTYQQYFTWFNLEVGFGDTGTVYIISSLA